MSSYYISNKQIISPAAGGILLNLVPTSGEDEFKYH